MMSKITRSFRTDEDIPLFTVIVPIYKVEEYLRRCIDSILSQTLSDFELLLIDDGSPDSCPLICDEYAKKDSRIRVVHKPNGGLVSARNIGVLEAKGQYICYVDGDDHIRDNLLERVYTKAIKEYEPDMVIFGAIRQFEDHQVHIESGLNEGIYYKEDLKHKLYPYMMYDNSKPFCNGRIFPVAWNKIYKRELLMEHYCKDERIRMGEDNAFVFEVIYYADSVYFCDDRLYYYNQLNNQSFIHRYDPLRFENNRFLFDYMEERLGGRDKILDTQLNAFRAYWIIMAVFHEVKSKRGLSVAARHISVKLKETGLLSGISYKDLPRSAVAFLTLLRFHMYYSALIGAKLVNAIRERREASEDTQIRSDDV